MADWTRREVTSRRVEYALPNPTNWAQIGSVYHMIERELASRLTTDDTVRVEGRDDEIVFSYEAASNV